MPWKKMWLIPARSKRSAAGLTSDSGTWKCSPSHVNDSEVDQGKVFRTDPAKIFAIAREAGYRGYFSIEFEGEGDPYTGTQKLIDTSARNM